MPLTASRPQPPPPAQNRSLLVPLIAVAGLLFVVVVFTRRGGTPPPTERAATGRAPAARPLAADGTESLGAEPSRGGDDVAGERTAAATPGTSGMWRGAPADGHARPAQEWTPTIGTLGAGRGAAPGVRSDVTPRQSDFLVGRTGDPGSTRRRRRRREPKADGETEAAAPVPPAAVGGHTVFSSDRDTTYETIEETQADLKRAEAVSAAGAISLWLEPAWDGTSQEDASLVRMGDGQFRIYKSGQYLRFEIVNSEGQTQSLGMPIASWKEAEWHNIVTTWDGQVISFFADGKLLGQNAYTGQIALGRDAKLFVGGTEEGMAAPGLVSDVRVRDQPLTLNDVQQRYAAGLLGHQSMPPTP